MTINVLCTVICDLRERDHNSSDFEFISLEPVNKGTGGTVSQVEGRFRIEGAWYWLDLTLQTSLGERKYKVNAPTSANGQSAFLWIAGGRIEADTINGRLGDTINIYTDRTVRCPLGVSPRVFSGIRLTLRGQIREV